MKSIELDRNFLEAWAHLTQVSMSNYSVLPSGIILWTSIYLWLNKKNSSHLSDIYAYGRWFHLQVKEACHGIYNGCKSLSVI
jgi:hypothetical protein